MNQANIRNFCVVAHIDHGKSTLADRLLEVTGTVKPREMQEQLLDSNPIERERGITIKLAPVRMEWEERPASKYILNLIDTPGHVDFSYEVSRSLAACEGALLVVDATQGVQAQTLANLRLAREHKLTIISIINKIDLPNARISETLEELINLGFGENEIIAISAKLGTNVDQVLSAIVNRIPAPQGEINAPLRGLVFSSRYDAHKGVVVFIRLVDGSIDLGSYKGLALAASASSARARPYHNLKLRFLVSGAEVTPIEVGYFGPQMIRSNSIKVGEVGYIATGLKDIRFAKVGDTITYGEITNHKSQIPNNLTPLRQNFAGQAIQQFSNVVPLPGYHEPKPMVFLGLYPLNSDELTAAREAMERLRLSDSAFSFKPISSLALGNGFHCGFLGMLHAEIVQERLSREFNLNMIATAPSVEYLIKFRQGVIPVKAGIQFIRPAEVASKNFDPSSESVTRRLGNSAATRVEDGQNFSSSPQRLDFAIQSASEFPDPSLVEEVREPVMSVTIFTPKKYVGNVMQLAQEKRGQFVDMKYYQNTQKTQKRSEHSENSEIQILSEDQTIRLSDKSDFPILRPSDLSESSEFSDNSQVELIYLMPLSEMIVDFFDRLKSITEGYASLDYEFYDYQPVEAVKLDILVNKEKVDALSLLVVKDQAQYRGREIVERLANVIPRQQFTIPIQAAIGGEVIARADVKAFRKDVIQKLYGGDRTRKDKLLEAQKRGKERMKIVGRVKIPQTAFFEVLKRE